MSDPILMVTPRWRRDGGVATHVMTSAAALAERGVEVHVLAGLIDDSRRPPGVVLHESPQLLDGKVAPEQRLGDALECDPRVAHLHQFEDPDLAAAIARRTALVFSVHGYSACTSGVHYFRPGRECHRAHGPGCVANLLGRGCAHTYNVTRLPRSYRAASSAVRLLREADLAISYSRVIDRHLETNGATRRAIVPLFATLEPVPGSGHEHRRRVVFAGRIVHAKGLQVLLHAVVDLDAELVICGDGHDSVRMEALATRLGIAERTAFRGWLAPEQLAVELAEASVVAIPSLWPEPFGLVGIEAFSAGRPVVASATGGIPEWLEEGVSGLAVAPGDTQALAAALSALLDDPAAQSRMGDAGRRAVAERFTAARHVEALMGAYESARAGWEQRRRTRIGARRD